MATTIFPHRIRTRRRVPHIIFRVEFPWRKLCYFFLSFTPICAYISTFIYTYTDTHIHTHTCVNIKFKFSHLFIYPTFVCVYVSTAVHLWILFIRQSHHVFSVVVVFIHFLCEFHMHLRHLILPVCMVYVVFQVLTSKSLGINLCFCQNWTILL